MGSANSSHTKSGIWNGISWQRRLKNKGAKSNIARDLIRTAENELIKQEIQEGMAKKIFGKEHFFELDKTQKSKVNRLIRNNIEINY